MNIDIDECVRNIAMRIAYPIRRRDHDQSRILRLSISVVISKGAARGPIRRDIDKAGLSLEMYP